MGFLDKLFNKKKEPTTFSGDLTIWDLKKGYLVDYFMESWEVRNQSTYDWGNNFISKEFELNNGKETIYFHVAKNNGFECSVTREVSLRKINSQLKEQIVDHDGPFKTLEYEGIKYYLEDEGEAHVSTTGENGSSRMVSWDYEADNEKNILSIGRWGRTDIEAYIGEVVNDYEFSNIIPKN